MRVGDLNRKSSIIGNVDEEIFRYDEEYLVESCVDSTIFVTASLRGLTLRNLTRCTVVAAPCTEKVTLLSCTECVISVAAPEVKATDLIGCLFFAAASAPVMVGGSSKDVRLGPYNVVGDGLLRNSGMKGWTVDTIGAGGSGFETFCRLDSQGATAVVRAVPPTDFYWRYLPVSQTREERLPLPPVFSTPEAPRISTLESRGSRSQRIEALTQMKFVVSKCVTALLGYALVSPHPPLFSMAFH